MRKHKVSLVLAAFLFLTTFSPVLSLDEDSAKESPCFNVDNAIDPDQNWALSVKTWYYTLASRLDLYRTAHDLLETDYSNIMESSVYYDSCVYTTMTPEGILVNGYNGRKRLMRTTQVAPGTFDFKSEGSEGMVGRVYITLTDNKTFIFYAACFADNQMSWNLFQTTKTLDEATTQTVFEHAKSLGYDPEFFTELRHDSCGNRGDDLTKAPGDAMSPMTPMYKTVPEEYDSDSLVCNMCRQVCPNLGSKNYNLFRYKKLAQKYKEMCAIKK